MFDLTAAEEVLLAASRLAKRRTKEFSEWDLTVETWKLNKNRWGLRGYEHNYPDHKRVMNEIMSKKTENILGKGWLTRTRPNRYRITATGLAKAATLGTRQVDTRPRAVFLYEAVKDFALHPVFRSYLKSPEEPRSWIGAAAFLSLSKNDPDILTRQLKNIDAGITDALAWMHETGTDSIRRGDAGQSITREELLKLREFVGILEKRFAVQLNAIRVRSDLK